MSNQPIQLYTENLMELNGDMSASITSASRKLSGTVSYSVQFIWDGTSPVGSVYLECSNIDNDVYYTKIDESQLPVTGNSGSHMINVEKPSYLFVRVKYIPASGSGTAQAVINGMSA